MMRSGVVQVVAVLLCGALLYGASTFAPSINRGRAALNMLASEKPEENAPPEYAFAIQALGAFRSLITDVAFIRAEEFKSQGRYYDAMQLHNWICKLQPRFPSVWEYCAWNMAWNISVTTYTPEERWNWVYNGVKLLRDEGLKFNPRAVNLYKQLAWIFNNKMSESVDEFHQDYKRNWAWRMHLLLGPAPDPLAEEVRPEDVERIQAGIASGSLAEVARFEYERRTGAAAPGAPAATRPAGAPTPAEIVKAAVLEKTREIADGPKTVAELYQRYPEAREMVQQLRALDVAVTDDVLNEDSYWREGGLAFTFFERYRKLTDPPSMLGRISKRKSDDPDLPNVQKLDQILGVKAGNPAGRAIVLFLQRKVLSEVYKLRPEALVELVQTFGPVDWRAVDAHSLYWVMQGLVAGKETLSTFRNDKTNTARLLFFSLRNLFLRNKITFEPNPQAIHRSYINLAPDLNFVEPLHQAYLTFGPLLDPDPGTTGGAGETYRVGHTNFLHEIIRMLYLSDRVPEAQYYFDYLRETYGRSPDGSPKPEFSKSLRDFVMDAFQENVDTYREANSAINALLDAAFDQLTQGSLPRYTNLVNIALDIHTNYMKEKADERSDRLRLPPFVEMQADRLREFMVEPALSDTQMVRKARLWAVTPINLKQRVYDDLQAPLKYYCDAFELDFAKAFPEPPGMAEWREKNPPRTMDRKETPEVETPAQQPG